MATLSASRRAWIQKIYGNEAAVLIREIESLPDQEQAEKAVTRLKNQVNETHAKSGASPAEHPGMGYFGQAFKSQRPAVTLKDIQKKAKLLSAAIKDAAETAAAQTILDLMELADDLELPQAGVLELARQYSIVEVTSILRTLSGQKSAGKAFKSAFYGTETKTPDIADVNSTLKQSRKSNRFWK